MQWKSATFIYHLNTMKDKVESYLKKKAKPLKQYSSNPEKLHLKKEH